MVTKKVSSPKKVATVAKAVPMPVQEISPTQAIMLLVQAGMSLENIAEQFGVTVEYVKNLAEAK